MVAGKPIADLLDICGNLIKIEKIFIQTMYEQDVHNAFIFVS